MQTSDTDDGTTVPFIQRLPRLRLSNWSEPYPEWRFQARLDHNIAVNRKVAEETFAAFEDRCPVSS